MINALFQNITHVRINWRRGNFEKLLQLSVCVKSWNTSIAVLEPKHQFMFARYRFIHVWLWREEERLYFYREFNKTFFSKLIVLSNIQIFFSDKKNDSERGISRAAYEKCLQKIDLPCEEYRRCFKEMQSPFDMYRCSHPKKFNAFVDHQLSCPHVTPRVPFQGELS
jgi:hypothetical protein